ncbi:hypothetical protein CYY_009611, partial [Polysphondylium violaceum]
MDINKTSTNSNDNNDEMDQVANEISISIEGLNQIFKDDMKSLRETVRKLKEKKQDLLQIKHVRDTSTIPNELILNVGGMEFHTSKQLLKSIPATFFDLMLSGEIDVQSITNQPDTYFIDRDGTYFRYVLHYLKDRVGSIVPYSIRDELIFYKLDTFSKSKIIADSTFLLFKNWINNSTKSNFKLLYRASENDYSGPTFKKKCCALGSTITVVQTTEGDVFGCYNDLSWFQN